MAAVMALQNGWVSEDDSRPVADSLQFKGKYFPFLSVIWLMQPSVNNDIHGLVDSVNDGSTSAFMWEWFTTKPYVDSGEVRFIGHVDSTLAFSSLEI